MGRASNNGGISLERVSALHDPGPGCIYGAVVTRRLRALGIRDKPIAPASPWQNGLVERLIGSIRRECVDHIIVLGEAHLRRVLKSYARYYDETRTHLALDKDAPLSRTVKRQGAFFAAQSSADCITNMFGFDFRHAQSLRRTERQHGLLR